MTRSLLCDQLRDKFYNGSDTPLISSFFIGGGNILQTYFDPYFIDNRAISRGLTVLYVRLEGKFLSYIHISDINRSGELSLPLGPFIS